jgi:hypothetical protein
MSEKPGSPVLIRRTKTIEEAEILIAWLDEHGVKATVLDPDSTGVFAFGVTDPEGVEVYVADEETAEKAKVLLAEHDAERDRAASAEGAAAAPIELKCEECGEVNTFESDLAGTVQECAECGAFVDVPLAED